MSEEITVLLVEDDPSFQKIVQLRLSAWRPGISITVASSIAEARRLLDVAEHPFSLVILDQHLPDGLGNELFTHEGLQDAAVLAVSADDTPHLPGAAVRAGAQHFLGKRQVSTPLFVPLVEALIERKRLESRLRQIELQRSTLDTIRVLLRTLRHEINNPLGAVLGGAFLVRSAGGLDEEQQRALRLIEQSGNRIKHVLEQLCETAELERVTKGREEVFQVPGDPKWESSETRNAPIPNALEKKEAE